ncbi:helix-turn-helix domain-containing protein [Gracilibacillus salitolerans]|uniref:Helix-turn-helix domain-containing protein n=1 Tax=Gracilibacillus salitolerans TaxID=2663022 RepID=A0A5Q2TFT4_9BACI|nr:AraC family transcriptional regulator [Gracilibacillus salitolerans]QGH32991.1 helix-turn-helix domain-containing protein [Gracilibacillus salitolerans]
MKNWYTDASLDWSPESIRSIVTPTPFAKNYFLYIQEVGHIIAKVSYFTERENVNSYLIVYTKKGKGTLLYEDKTYYLEENDLFFIDCRNYQFYKTVGDNDWDLYFLHFDGAQSQHFYQLFHSNGVILRGADNQMVGLYQQLIDTSNQHNSQSELLIHKYITDLLTEILLASSSLQITYIPNIIQEIRDYIEEHYQQKITLDILAQLFPISKYHLSRQFKQYIGMTPYHLQLSIRLNHAKNFLKYSNITIEEIAYYVGFDETSHFIRIFKNQEKVTPLVFRKMWWH